MALDSWPTSLFVDTSNGSHTYRKLSSGTVSNFQATLPPRLEFFDADSQMLPPEAAGGHLNTSLDFRTLDRVNIPRVEDGISYPIGLQRFGNNA